MPFSFIDLYAGCGGLSLGLAQSGGTGVLAVEKSPDAFKTLWHNLSKPRHLPSMAWPEGIPKEAHEIRTLLTKYGHEVGQLRGTVDVVAGGPPCQGFSMYGKRNPHDPRNHLWTAYLQFVEKVSPRVVLLENVEGIDRPFIRGREDSGKNCRETAAHRILRNLEALGFVTKTFRLCASDYGVPQHRPRFFLIGFKSGNRELVDSILSEGFLEEMRLAHLARIGAPAHKKYSVADAISDLETEGKVRVPCPDSKGFMQAKYSGPRTSYQESMRAEMPEADTAPNSIRLARHKESTVYKFNKIQEMEVRGYKVAAKINALLGTTKHRVHWLNPDQPAPTITTLPDDFIHYSEPRILSARECARIQSFPDWFEFLGKYTTGGERRKMEVPRFTQIGNAVPPRLALFLGSYINEALVRIRNAKDEQLAA